MTPASPRIPSNVVDHVGSLVRPAELKHAWREWEAGHLSAAALNDVEDLAIGRAVKIQEEIGLQVVTDGEFRRGGWSRGFLAAVDGFDFRPSRLTFRNDEISTPAPAPVAIKPLRRVKPIVTDDYKFLRTVAKGRVKVTMPTPSHLHFGQFKQDAYPDQTRFWDDLIAIYRQELAELYDAGCRYLQLDEVPLPLLCDATIREIARSEGYDPEALVDLYIDAINRVVADRPADLTVAMHLCRGNMEGLWMGDGGYAPIAERVFTRCAVDAFLLEYDSPRAGDFAPLRHLPADKRAYLGLVSSKKPEIESADDLARRLDEAGRHAAMERLGLCPQCGFGSAAMSKFAVVASPITAELERAKLSRLVEVGRRTWGHA
jgi:5-methyltetrahydropteroyltriglutamate--homocysteine methyltransferase